MIGINLKKISCKDAFYFCLLMGLFYYCICVVQEAYTKPFFLYNYIIAIMSFLMLFLFFWNFAVVKQDWLDYYLLLFVLVSLIPTFILYESQGMVIQFARIADMLLWIGTFYCSRKYGDFKMLPLFLVMILVHLMLWFPVQAYHKMYGTPLISNAYFSLFLIPFALMQRKGILKWSFVLLCLIPVLLSEKRTGFLTAIIGIVCYIYFHFRTKKRKGRLKRFIITTLSILLIIGIIVFIVQKMDLRIFERLDNIAEDQGSGRVDVWVTTWHMIWESSGIEILIGHGFNAVVFDSPLGFSAHNDFLEVLYNHGLAGLIAYCGFIYSIIKRAIIYYKKGVKHSDIFLASVAMFLIFSMTSHLVLYPTYFIYLCIFWGSFIGSEERKTLLRGDNDRDINI